MKFWLFGDSFFDLPGYENDKIYWVDLLPNTVNLSLGGTGPHYMLPILEKYISKISRDDVIICHISDKDRITFPSSIIASDQMMYITKTGLQSGYDDKRLANYYDKNKNSIDFTFKTFEKIIESLPQLIVSYLYSLDVKSIVFCSSPITHRPKNTNNFHLSNYSLFDISINEFIDFDGDLKGVIDSRNNHLSDENHLILIEYIHKVLAKEKLPTFKEKFIFQKNVIKKINSDMVFIYE